MRGFTFFVLLVLTASPVFAHKDRIEPARTLTIGFKTKETATFTVANGAVIALTLHVGKADYAVPQAECAKLRDIHFETIALLWNGSYKSAAGANYFYLRFQMGTEEAKTFDELPTVEVMFLDKKFEQVIVRKKTSQDTWQDFKL